MLHEMEKRALSGISVRARKADELPAIEGHFAVFRSLSEPIYGWFKEELMEGCMARTLREKADHKVLFDHKSAQVIGCREAKTCTMKTDDVGLWIDVPEPPPTTWCRDLIINMERKEIKSASIGFYVRTTKWRQEDGWDVREIYDMDLVEGSVVTFPAYSATSVGVRSFLPSDMANLDKICRAVNRIENKLDLVDEDRAILRENVRFLEENLPPEKRKLILDVVGPVQRHVPLDAWRQYIEVQKLKG